VVIVNARRELIERFRRSGQESALLLVFSYIDQSYLSITTVLSSRTRRAFATSLTLNICTSRTYSMERLVNILVDSLSASIEPPSLSALSPSSQLATATP